MDIISQLQEQVNSIAAITFNTFGTLQRDAPPVQLSPNYPELPATSTATDNATPFPEQPKQLSAGLVKAAKQFDALVAALPLSEGGEEAQLKRIAQLQGENLKPAIDKCCLDLCEADCYDSLNYVFIVCDIVVRLRLLRTAVEDVFAGFHATKIAVRVQHLNLFDKREASCLEANDMRLKQFHSCVEALEANDGRLKQFHSCVEALEANEARLKQFHSCVEALQACLKQFHSHVSAHMRLMEQSSPLIEVMEADCVLLDRDCVFQKDCAQLVKANSIQGNKVNNVDVVYTPWFNLKKTASIGVGQAGFHISKMVRIIRNRLNKTKVERTADLRAEREAVNAAESAGIAGFSAEALSVLKHSQETE